MSHIVATLPSVTAFIEKDHGHFINGKSILSTGSERINVYNPADGSILTTVAKGSLEDLEKSVQSAHHALMDRRWSGMRPADRERILLNFTDLLFQKQEIFAQLETLNQGKSIHLSRAVEVGATIEYMRYMSGWATKITGETMDVSIAVPSNTKYMAYTQRQPIGVVAGISPWNFPLMIGVWKVFLALVAGCPVVLKPSSETPLTALLLAELALEAGIPEGVFNVITGAGSVIGQGLAAHPLIRKITFTGSTDIGKVVGHAAIDHMAHFSLELGGKNPVIMLDDINVEKAVSGALMGGLFNGGQVCAAASRFYVHRSKFEQVVEALVAATSQMTLGCGMDLDAQVNPLVSQKQQASVLDYLAKARHEGACIYGGIKPDQLGFYVVPAIVTGLEQSHTIVQEEVFGPVLAVLPFDDDNDAIQLANDSRYGLTASLWTNDLTRAMHMIPQIEAGTVWVNSHIPLDPAMPFGGVKESGMGREFGKGSVESFTELKSVCIAH